MAAVAQRIVTTWQDAPPEARRRALAAWEQIWRDPATGVAFQAAWELARRSERTGAWDVATRHPSPVVRDALITCVVADLVNPCSYTVAQQSLLRRPWAAVFGDPCGPSGGAGAALPGPTCLTQRRRHPGAGSSGQPSASSRS